MNRFNFDVLKQHNGCTEAAAGIQALIAQVGINTCGGSGCDANEFLMLILDAWKEQSVHLPINVTTTNMWRFHSLSRTGMPLSQCVRISSVRTPAPIIVGTSESLADVATKETVQNMSNAGSLAKHTVDHTSTVYTVHPGFANQLVETVTPDDAWFIACSISHVGQTLLHETSTVIKTHGGRSYCAVALCVHTGGQHSGHYTCVRATSIRPDSMQCEVLNDAHCTKMPLCTSLYAAYAAAVSAHDVVVAMLYKHVPSGTAVTYDGPRTTGICNVGNSCYANAAIQLLAPIFLTH